MQKISTLQDNAPLSEELRQDELNANLPSLIELESSGAGFEHFSPETFRNLSMNFERWMLPSICQQEVLCSNY